MAAASTAVKRLKIVTLGDSGVGKTSLLIVYLTGAPSRDYIPNILDPFVQDDTVDEKDVAIEMFDLGGGEDYHRLRYLNYPKTDAFVLCYSIESRPSFENIKTIWFPELRHYCPNVPILLVANKLDLRNNDELVKELNEENKSLVTMDEGLSMAEEFGAVKFIECSAIMQINNKEVFQEAARYGLARNIKKNNKRCLIV